MLLGILIEPQVARLRSLLTLVLVHVEEMHPDEVFGVTFWSVLVRLAEPSEGCLEHLAGASESLLRRVLLRRIEVIEAGAELAEKPLPESCTENTNSL